MSSLITARSAFVVAIGLLVACALIVYGTDRGFLDSIELVQHTQQVEVLLGDTESAMASAGRARLTYIFSGDEPSLQQYKNSVAEIPVALAKLRQSTKDNSIQQANCDRLEKLVNERVQLWEKSIAMKQSGQHEAEGQPEMTRQSVAVADEIISVTQQMRSQESELLEQRRARARFNFFLARGFRVTTFLTAVLLLFWHYRLVREELQARERAEDNTRIAAAQAHEAEHKARESEKAAIASNEAARHLSARLMRLQDEERRRLARDLHDSTGQYLAAAKMALASLAAGNGGDPRYAECMQLLDRSLKEVRTLSHLLHPSGLEEAGFPAAARWYAEEFARRSGIQMSVDVPDLKGRLPREIEIALFRILQEALGNIHRHSRSQSAEVSFRAEGQAARLTIIDQGVGISAELLERFRSSGYSGVGLAAIRERVRELQGSFDIQSDRNGTSLQVEIPVPEHALAAKE